MDGVDWEHRAVMPGQAAYQHHPASSSCRGRPKLEIPNPEPATPRRRGAAAAISPRGIYEFPPSPQSPGDVAAALVLSPVRGAGNGRSRSWVQETMEQQLMPPPPIAFSSAQNSPSSNHPAHGFGECGADFSRNWAYRAPAMAYNFGEYVLVRCNQTKWLVGQVRRISGNGIKVWIGAAQILVNVPAELFPTHLARMDCQTPPSSPTEAPAAAGAPGPADLKARVQCVRPAHLSHRHLYQHLAPGPPAAGFAPSPHQMQLVQFPSPAPKDSHHEGYGRWVPPPADAGSPSKLPELVAACFEKEQAHVPRSRSIVKLLSEPLNTVSEEGAPAGNLYPAGSAARDPQQVQYSWRHHGAPGPQHGKRPSYRRPLALSMLNVYFDNEGTPGYSVTPTGGHEGYFGTRQSYPRPSALPVLNLGLNTEGTPTSAGTPAAEGANLNPRPSWASTSKGPYADPAGSPVFVAAVDVYAAPLRAPLYEQVTSPTGRPGGRTPPAHVCGKDKAVCEESRACPKWPGGTVFHPGGGGPATVVPLERSVSLDGSRSRTPTFPGVGSQWSLGARPATFSAEPVWVTVIENGHGMRRAQ